MKEEKVFLEGENIKIVTKLPKNEIEDNNLKKLLDKTTNLEEVVKEINHENK